MLQCFVTNSAAAESCIGRCIGGPYACFKQLGATIQAAAPLQTKFEVTSNTLLFVVLCLITELTLAGDWLQASCNRADSASRGAASGTIVFTMLAMKGESTGVAQAQKRTVKPCHACFRSPRPSAQHKCTHVVEQHAMRCLFCFDSQVCTLNCCARTCGAPGTEAQGNCCIHDLFTSLCNRRDALLMRSTL